MIESYTQGASQKSAVCNWQVKRSQAGVCSAERPGWVFSKPEELGNEQKRVFSALKMLRDLG